VTPVRHEDVRVRIVGELRDEIDVQSIAAALVDAALAITERDDRPGPGGSAGHTDDDDRKADDS
jgi:hypothetical protein